MPTFVLDFVNRNGRRTTQRIDAIDEASAELYVKETLGGYHIGAKETGSRYRNHKLKVPRKRLSMALEAVTLLIEAGATVDVAFRAVVTRVPPGKLRYMMSHIARHLEARGEVGAALAQFPQVFTPAVVGVVTANERGGTLPEGFAEICNYFRGLEEVRGDVLKGLFIPAIGLIAGVGCAGVIFGFTLPRFKKFVQEMVGLENLNPLSKFYFDTSDFVVAHPILCVSAVFLAPFFVWWLWGRTFFRRFVFKVANRLPMIGRALEAVGLARLCTTYSTLSKSKFLPLETIEMCKAVVGHELLAQGLEKVRVGVLDNRGVGESFQKAKEFPHEFSTAIALAEHNLTAIFKKLGVFYTRESKTRINLAISAIEPTMVVLLGLFALSAGLAIILPVTTVINKLSGQ